MLNQFDQVYSEFKDHANMHKYLRDEERDAKDEAVHIPMLEQTNDSNAYSFFGHTPRPQSVPVGVGRGGLNARAPMIEQFEARKAKKEV